MCLQKGGPVHDVENEKRKWKKKPGKFVDEDCC